MRFLLGRVERKEPAEEEEVEEDGVRPRDTSKQLFHP